MKLLVLVMLLLSGCAETETLVRGTTSVGPLLRLTVVSSQREAQKRCATSVPTAAGCAISRPLDVATWSCEIILWEPVVTPTVLLHEFCHCYAAAQGFIIGLDEPCHKEGHTTR